MVETSSQRQPNEMNVTPRRDFLPIDIKEAYERRTFFNLTPDANVTGGGELTVYMLVESLAKHMTRLTK